VKGPLLLAVRQLAHDRVRTTLLAACLALAVAIPATTALQTRSIAGRLTERAETTPLVVGPSASEFDVTLHALYFQAAPQRTIAYREAGAAGEGLDALVVPLYGVATAQGAPLIGTTLDYFDQRRLTFAEGDAFLRWGDCVVGAAVAERLNLSVGGRLLSDAENRFDLAGDYPLAMRVAGVLAPTGGPDDEAVFVDLPTAWIVAGIGHGHQDVTQVHADDILSREGNAVAVGADVTSFVEITDENVDSFHFHGEEGERPLTCLLVFPRDARAETLLLGRYQGREEVQAVRTREVIDRLVSTVFRVQGLLTAMTATLSVIALACMGFAFALSLRMRRREFETLTEIGASRGTVAMQIACEALGVMVLALVLAALLVLAADWLAAPLIERMALGLNRA
jgi:putative ABC transport system permease protein